MNKEAEFFQSCKETETDFNISNESYEDAKKDFRQRKKSKTIVILNVNDHQ